MQSSVENTNHAYLSSDYAHIPFEHKDETLDTPIQQYIHISKYSRWIDEQGRRETWPETCQRYMDYMYERTKKLGSPMTEDEYRFLYESILFQRTMPSMRAMMTAGKAMDAHDLCCYNCSYCALNDPRAFSELLYITACFQADTEVRVKSGVKRISDITLNDEVLSYNEDSKKYSYIKPEKIHINPTQNSKKLELTFEDGTKVLCTEEHQFLTTNRGWVSARDLTDCDDIKNKDTYTVYKLTNNANGKIYVGFTSLDPNIRFYQHLVNSRTKNQRKTFLHKAITKYGKHVWSIENLHITASREEAVQLEILEIERNKSRDPEVGYNLTAGGDGCVGGRVTDETRAKMRDSWTPEKRKARSQMTRQQFLDNPINNSKYLVNYMRGGISLEHRKKLSMGQMGDKNPIHCHVFTPEEREERRQNALGTNNNFYGRRHSIESKLKMSNSHTGKYDGVNNPAAKPITINGVFYGTLQEAKLALGLKNNDQVREISCNEN